MSVIPPERVPEKGFYYHYKHDPSKSWNDHCYEVTGVARHTEDKSFLVLYIPLYKNDWFAPADFQARPLQMFVENVEKDGKTFPRFAKIIDPEIISKLEIIKKEMYK